jgi:hypothetical protein
MVNEVIIRVLEVVGSDLCVASDDGERVYNRVMNALSEDRKVNLSFANVASLTSAFLNTAVGQLYGRFTEAQIRSGLRVSDMEQDDLVLLKRVVDTAKEYFRNPERIMKARRDVLEDDDAE